MVSEYSIFVYFIMIFIFVNNHNLLNLETVYAVRRLCTNFKPNLAIHTLPLKKLLKRRFGTLRRGGGYEELKSKRIKNRDSICIKSVCTKCVYRFLMKSDYLYYPHGKNR